MTKLHHVSTKPQWRSHHPIQRLSLGATNHSNRATVGKTPIQLTTVIRHFLGCAVTGIDGGANHPLVGRLTTRLSWKSFEARQSPWPVR